MYSSDEACVDKQLVHQAITSALEDAREKEIEKNKDNSTMGFRVKRSWTLFYSVTQN